LFSMSGNRQESAKNKGCTVRGMCGKPEETANLQDLLIFVLKGISVYGDKLKELGAADRSNDDYIAQGLFATITNANWDDARFVAMITDGLKRRDQIKARFLAAYREKNGRAFFPRQWPPSWWKSSEFGPLARLRMISRR
jgi:hydroxylamine reductase